MRLQPALAGKCIWLTRPAHQSAAWADVLEAAGADVINAPLLTIEPAPDAARARRALADAEHADIVIATSRNAVDAAWRLCPQFSPVGALYAVGATTAAVFEQAAGRAVGRPADGVTSEHLLAMPSLAALDGWRVALLSGEGGRTHLAETLAARGAQIDRIALYRRRPVPISAQRLAALIGAADAIVITSGEALAHLVTLAGSTQRAALADTVLVAPSLRVVKQQQNTLDWTHPPAIVERMSGEAIVASLARVWQGNRQ